LREFVWQDSAALVQADGNPVAASLGRRRLRYGLLVLGLGALVLLGYPLGPHATAAVSTLPAGLGSAAELLSLVLAALAFGTVWNARVESLSLGLLALGCGLLAVALLDGGQLLERLGVPWPGAGVNPLGTGLALAARVTAAASLLAATLLPWRAPVVPKLRLAMLLGPLAICAGWFVWLAAGSPWVGAAARVLVPAYALICIVLGHRLFVRGRYCAPNGLLLAGATCLLFAEVCLPGPGEALPVLGHCCRALAGLFLYRATLLAGVQLPLLGLQENLSRFRQMLEAAPDSILVIDGEGRIAAVNIRAQAMFACSRDQLLGQPVEILIPSKLRRAHQASRRAFADAPRTREMGSGIELLALRGDGSEFPAEVSLSPLVTGTTHWVMCVVRDITARKEAERDLRRREEELRVLMESSPDLVLLVCGELRLRYANPAIARVEGQPPGAYVGKTLADVFPGAADDRVTRLLAQVFASGVATSFELPCRLGGKLRQYLIRMVPEFGEGGQVECVIVVAPEITDLVEAREENRRLATILESLPDLVSITAATGELNYLNPAGRKMLEQAASADSKTLFHEHCHPHWVNRRILEEAIPTALQNGMWRGESAILYRDGSEVPVMQTIVAHKNDKGQVLYWSSVIQDFSERKQLEDQLLHLATHDALTALPNRALFLDRLRQAAHHARRTARLTAVLFMDLDDFKTINDTLGHPCGDELLGQVAQRLTSGLRSGDTVGRLGGDEFALILEGMERTADICALVEKLQAQLAEPYELQGRRVSLSSSIGITLYPNDDEDPLALLRKADIAMYQAKKLGRGGYKFYAAEMDNDMQERLELREDLRHAVARGELLLHYQPKVDLESGRVRGMEALVRWNHPVKGLISPATFIPIAEASDLILALDLWVLRAACTQNRAWQAMGLPPLRVAVNLSARQFADGELVTNVARTLAETGLEACYLELEITESMVMEYPDVSLRTLHGLKTLGVFLSIDDFGTGYSSLSYLRRFPVDTIKIDRSFVLEAPGNANDAAIASAIISMAHRLGLQVVAEGVETRAHVEFLSHHQCDEIQGFFISRPLPPGDFEQFLRPSSGRAVPAIPPLPGARPGEWRPAAVGDRIITPLEDLP
jgi:diguanylate cyclase (GGDEF)-like protein/PAS domain S-box-containing protein